MGICSVTHRAEVSALWNTEGWDRVGDRREGQEGGNICISIADSFDIQQKLTQYC